ncbi:uncharacterized protein F5891DRAFT_1023010 [Suillus fuscotomentosus]|uniref:DUF726-domain-containing protein n=1 Tax=Suillus fuscotomentosus TaxID=1912939 RepID=A0AAD4HM32_9AGAM|nr:uncharacterized protein F5891DRAFT_1023010 [Suillus fuscotomentosus]KAG1902700.1 hypothetical protein F5891DRAFT_1023010 [Suillus fuscotomentosus]
MPVEATHPTNPFSFDDDDEEGWQEMPVIKEDDFGGGLDEEDQKKYHYMPSSKKPVPSASTAGNATGNLIDFDEEGVEWHCAVNEEDEADEVHLRTRYLFDEDKAMTPLSQMQATKNMLTEAQRIAYVGVCALTAKEMVQKFKTSNRKELKTSLQHMELWAMKIMGRLYYHMELETAEQKMIDSLAVHGVQAIDLVPSLMTTHTVANPEYDPVEARRQAETRGSRKDTTSRRNSKDDKLRPSCLVSDGRSPPQTPTSPSSTTQMSFQTTAKVLEGTAVDSASMGVTTTLSSAEKDVTLDIRWTVLCDLFLMLIADSVYDARSRVLLESVALKLGLGWLDVVKFEARVTEALEIQEGVEKMENQEIIEGSSKAARKKRYMMMGLATLGGGLVIGLSAGLLAPVIGAGLGAAFTAVGISGTTGFLAGAGGAAVITTGGILTGSGIAVQGMARRTQQVRTFDVLPLHNNKRVSCILTVPGFMNGKLDDVRLPFSVLDPIVGDVFSILWEPEMIQETGSALKILTGEILSQTVQTVLQHTVMTALMSGLQWPIILTKLGYLIDNPWNNALDRARAAGSVLAQLLIHRHLGVRPITLIGFSLGARVIFYALLDLAKAKAFGIVQDVFLLGATLTASTSTWCNARSVVSGRFVNAFARHDWVLNYLFRATSGGLNTVAGLRPIENVPGLENVDVTDKISGHMSYRAFMPLILDQLGFPVSCDYFDEPVEPEFNEERVVVREGDHTQKKKWFSRKKKPSASPTPVSRPPSTASFASSRRKPSSLGKTTDDDNEPPREFTGTPPPQNTNPHSTQSSDDQLPSSSTDIPVHAGFDLKAIKDMIGQSEKTPEDMQVPQPSQIRLSLGISESPPAYTITPTDVANPPGLSVTDTYSSAGLSATFATSLHNVPDSGDDVDDGQGIPPIVDDGPSSSDHLSYLSSATSPHNTIPQISFGRNETSIWSPPLPEKTSPFGNPFAAGTVSFENSSISTNGLPPAAGPSASLSFGGTDGTITSQGMGRDPWSIPVDQKKTPNYLANPWST